MANFKYKINIKDIQDRYKFKVFVRSGADIPKSITDDISSIKSSNEELKRSIEELKSETNKIIEENIKKKSQNQNMYNALRTIYTNNIKDKVVETNKIWLAHNGNKQTTNQFIIRNIMLSESSSDWDENYFKKSFIINHFDNIDDKFVELIDEMINLDLENKRYLLSSD